MKRILSKKYQFNKNITDYENWKKYAGIENQNLRNI